jgi:hypothetical protein
MTEKDLGFRMIRLGLMPGVQTIAAQLHTAPVAIRVWMMAGATPAEHVAANEEARAIEAELVADAARMAKEITTEAQRRRALSTDYTDFTDSGEEKENA